MGVSRIGNIQVPPEGEGGSQPRGLHFKPAGDVALSQLTAHPKPVAQPGVMLNAMQPPGLAGAVNSDPRAQKLCYVAGLALIASE